MRIHLVFVGKTGFPDLDSAISRYLERLRHYCQIEIHHVKAEKISGASAEEMVRSREAERIMKLAGSQGHLVVLDAGGQEMDSPGLAKYLERTLATGIPDLWMVIGGPVGISAQLLKKARDTLSLSRMTFPHDLVRLMLVEQLYRAFTIIRREPYHK